MSKIHPLLFHPFRFSTVALSHGPKPWLHPPVKSALEPRRNGISKECIWRRISDTSGSFEFDRSTFVVHPLWMATDLLDATSFSQSLAPKPPVYIQLIPPICHAALWSSLSFGSLTVDALQHTIALLPKLSTPTGLAEHQLLSDTTETPKPCK